MAQVAVRLAIGTPVALAVDALLASEVYGAAFLLAAAATVAGLIPALRAATIDPVKALRVDG